MKNIEKPILMGYSMGAYICALVASEIEVSGLILLDGAGQAEEKQQKLIIPSLSRLKKLYDSADDYVSQTKRIYDGLNVEWDEAVEDITRYEVKETPDGWKHKSDAEVMEKDFNSFYDFQPGPVFEKIDCPTLLVIAFGRLGQNDPLFTKETYAETIAKAKDLMTIEVPANHYTLMFEEAGKSRGEHTRITEENEEGEGVSINKETTISAAIENIKSGQTIMVGGFGLIG